MTPAEKASDPTAHSTENASHVTSVRSSCLEVLNCAAARSLVSRSRRVASRSNGVRDELVRLRRSSVRWMAEAVAATRSGSVRPSAVTGRNASHEIPQRPWRGLIVQPHGKDGEVQSRGLLELLQDRAGVGAVPAAQHDEELGPSHS